MKSLPFNTRLRKLLPSLSVALVAHMLTLQASAAELLQKQADIPLPGGATRFDYQSFDADAGRLYFSHMGDGELMVFDTTAQKLVAHLPGFPTMTACESGGVSLFKVQNGTLAKLGDADVGPNSHTVAVDSKTHKAYFPLKSVNGAAVLRIMTPARTIR